ncbi:MAG TPA: alpha/beta hydrolase [Myxococcota bacterium]|nr:alpha/beta hydrolase [Myxococcota bacterium]
MNTLARDGVRIAYEEDGTAAEPIVFVHGWCCDHRYFAPQFAHFSARHRVVALDQRGFGASDKPQQKYTIEGFADDVAWLCRELGLVRPAVVGHSMGGAIALALAARHPDLPRAIALCDPAVVLPSYVRDTLGPFAQALLAPGYREVATQFVEQRLFGPSDDPARKARILAEMCATPQHVMQSAFESLAAFDSDSAARACRVPVLLIDAEVPLPDRARFKELCPQLVCAQTAGAGHFHQLEVPEQVNAMLERFLYTNR